LNSTITQKDSSINQRVNNEVSTLNSTITEKDSSISQRVTNEVSTLNSTITEKDSSMSVRINNLDSRLTSETSAIHISLISTAENLETLESRFNVLVDGSGDGLVETLDTIYEIQNQIISQGGVISSLLTRASLSDANTFSDVNTFLSDVIVPDLSVDSNNSNAVNAKYVNTYTDAYKEFILKSFFGMDTDDRNVYAVQGSKLLNIFSISELAYYGGFTVENIRAMGPSQAVGVSGEDFTNSEGDNADAYDWFIQMSTAEIPSPVNSLWYVARSVRSYVFTSSQLSDVWPHIEYFNNDGKDDQVDRIFTIDEVFSAFEGNITELSKIFTSDDINEYATNNRDVIPLSQLLNYYTVKTVELNDTNNNYELSDYIQNNNVTVNGSGSILYSLDEVITYDLSGNNTIIGGAKNYYSNGLLSIKDRVPLSQYVPYINTDDTQNGRITVPILRNFFSYTDFMEVKENSQVKFNFTKLSPQPASYNFENQFSPSDYKTMGYQVNEIVNANSPIFTAYQLYSNQLQNPNTPTYTADEISEDLTTYSIESWAPLYSNNTSANFSSIYDQENVINTILKEKNIPLVRFRALSYTDSSLVTKNPYTDRTMNNASSYWPYIWSNVIDASFALNTVNTSDNDRRNNAAVLLYTSGYRHNDFKVMNTPLTHVRNIPNSGYGVGNASNANAYLVNLLGTITVPVTDAQKISFANSTTSYINNGNVYDSSDNTNNNGYTLLDFYRTITEFDNVNNSIKHNSNYIQDLKKLADALSGTYPEGGYNSGSPSGTYITNTVNSLKLIMNITILDSNNNPFKPYSKDSNAKSLLYNNWVSNGGSSKDILSSGYYDVSDIYNTYSNDTGVYIMVNNDLWKDNNAYNNVHPYRGSAGLTNILNANNFTKSHIVQGVELAEGNNNPRKYVEYSDYRNAGFTVSELYNAFSSDNANPFFGASGIEKLLTGNYTINDIITAKKSDNTTLAYNGSHFVSVFLPTELYNYVNSSSEYPFQQLNAISKYDLLNNNAYTISQLIDAGFTAAQFNDANVTPAQLINSGHSTLQIVNGGIKTLKITYGFTMQQIWDSDIPTKSEILGKDSYGSGNNVQLWPIDEVLELSQNGVFYNTTELKKLIGYDLQNSYPVALQYTVANLMAAGVTDAELREVGATVTTIYTNRNNSAVYDGSAGVILFTNLGYNKNDIVSSNLYSTTALREGGYSVGDIKAVIPKYTLGEGAVKEFKTGGYTIQQIYDAYVPSDYAHTDISINNAILGKVTNSVTQESTYERLWSAAVILSLQYNSEPIFNNTTQVPMLIGYNGNTTYNSALRYTLANLIEGGLTIETMVASGLSIPDVVNALNYYAPTYGYDSSAGIVALEQGGYQFDDLYSATDINDERIFTIEEMRLAGKSFEDIFSLVVTDEAIPTKLDAIQAFKNAGYSLQQIYTGSNNVTLGYFSNNELVGESNGTTTNIYPLWDINTLFSLVDVRNNNSPVFLNTTEIPKLINYDGNDSYNDNTPFTLLQLIESTKISTENRYNLLVESTISASDFYNATKQSTNSTISSYFSVDALGINKFVEIGYEISDIRNIVYNGETVYRVPQLSTVFNLTQISNLNDFTLLDNSNNLLKTVSQTYNAISELREVYSIIQLTSDHYPLFLFWNQFYSLKSENQVNDDNNVCLSLYQIKLDNTLSSNTTVGKIGTIRNILENTIASINTSSKLNYLYKVNDSDNDVLFTYKELWLSGYTLAQLQTMDATLMPTLYDLIQFGSYNDNKLESRVSSVIDVSNSYLNDPVVFVELFDATNGWNDDVSGNKFAVNDVFIDSSLDTQQQIEEKIYKISVIVDQFSKVIYNKSLTDINNIVNSLFRRYGRFAYNAYFDVFIKPAYSLSSYFAYNIDVFNAAKDATQSIDKRGATEDQAESMETGTLYKYMRSLDYLNDQGQTVSEVIDLFTSATFSITHQNPEYNLTTIILNENPSGNLFDVLIDTIDSCGNITGNALIIPGTYDACLNIWVPSATQFTYLLDKETIINHFTARELYNNGVNSVPLDDMILYYKRHLVDASRTALILYDNATPLYSFTDFYGYFNSSEVVYHDSGVVSVKEIYDIELSYGLSFDLYHLERYMDYYNAGYTPQQLLTGDIDMTINKYVKSGLAYLDITLTNTDLQNYYKLLRHHLDSSFNYTVTEARDLLLHPNNEMWDLENITTNIVLPVNPSGALLDTLIDTIDSCGNITGNGLIVPGTYDVNSQQWVSSTTEFTYLLDKVATLNHFTVSELYNAGITSIPVADVYDNYSLELSDASRVSIILYDNSSSLYSFGSIYPTHTISLSAFKQSGVVSVKEIYDIDVSSNYTFDLNDLSRYMEYYQGGYTPQELLTGDIDMLVDKYVKSGLAYLDTTLTNTDLQNYYKLLRNHTDSSFNYTVTEARDLFLDSSNGATQLVTDLILTVNPTGALLDTLIDTISAGQITGDGLIIPGTYDDTNNVWVSSNTVYTYLLDKAMTLNNYTISELFNDNQRSVPVNDIYDNYTSFVGNADQGSGNAVRGSLNPKPFLFKYMRYADGLSSSLYSLAQLHQLASKFTLLDMYNSGVVSPNNIYTVDRQTYPQIYGTTDASFSINRFREYNTSGWTAAQIKNSIGTMSWSQFALSRFPIAQVYAYLVNTSGNQTYIQTIFKIATDSSENRSIYDVQDLYANGLGFTFKEIRGYVSSGKISNNALCNSIKTLLPPQERSNKTTVANRLWSLKSRDLNVNTFGFTINDLATGYQTARDSNNNIVDVFSTANASASLDFWIDYLKTVAGITTIDEMNTYNITSVWHKCFEDLIGVSSYVNYELLSSKGFSDEFLAKYDILPPPPQEP
jgi:hypothetical protein